MKDQSQILKWITEKGIKTNKGQKIEFNDHYFLLDYLQDNNNRIVVQKPTQVGVSFTTILKILYLGDQDSLSVIYTLPTSSEARDFVVSKFDPIIERSTGLKDKVQKIPFRDKPVWSSVLKRIGQTYYFFRGSWVAWRAQSIDADVLVVDELDFQKPEIRSMYEERLEGSTSKDIIYWIGYPSIPGYGISELYQQSDQREWFIQCPHCKDWQTLSWPESISIQKKTYVCKFCRKDLADEDRKKGVWKAQFPGRPIHGYAINKLMSSWIPATKIIKSFQQDSPKHFHNYTLGLPYLEKKNELTDEILAAGTIGHELYETLKTEHVICGIDQGDQFNFIAGVGTNVGPIVTSAEICKSPQEVEQRLDYYQPEIIVIDAMPDKHIAKLMQQKYGPQKFFLTNIRNWSEGATARLHFEVKRGLGLINLERTESIDFMFEAIKDGTVKFKADTPYLNLLFTQLRNLVPDYEERHSRVRKVWKSVGKDDFAFALNFFLTGYQILFPERELLETNFVPSARDENPFPGSSEWIFRDFETSIRKVSNPEGTIVILPKNHKKND